MLSPVTPGGFSPRSEPLALIHKAGLDADLTAGKGPRVMPTGEPQGWMSPPSALGQGCCTWGCERPAEVRPAELCLPVDDRALPGHPGCAHHVHHRPGLSRRGRGHWPGAGPPGPPPRNTTEDAAAADAESTWVALTAQGQLQPASLLCE